MDRRFFVLSAILSPVIAAVGIKPIYFERSPTLYYGPEIPGFMTLSAVLNNTPHPVKVCLSGYGDIWVAAGEFVRFPEPIVHKGVHVNDDGIPGFWTIPPHPGR